MSGMDGINSLQKMLGALQVNEPKNVGGTSAASATHTPKSPVTANGALDSASLSAAAGLAASSGTQATDNSDVRMDKVTQLQQAIASGTYNVPASAVADKMVESLLN